MVGYDNDPVYKNILLDLQFKEGSGVIAHDSAKPHHKNPTLQTNTTWAQLANDKNVLDFADINPSYVSITHANSGDLGFTTGTFSVSFWLKPDVLDNWLIGKADGGNGWSVYLQGDGSIRYVSQAGFAPFNTDTKTGLISIGVWAFVTLVRVGLNIYMYVNGLQQNILTNTINSTAPAVLFTIGANGTGNQRYDGQMADVRIWERELSKEHVRAIFESERGIMNV